MLRAQFVVLESDGVWKIRRDGATYGPYMNQRAAILAAIDAADRTPASNYEPRVVLQSRLRGSPNVEWTRGDPPPADLAYFRALIADTRERRTRFTMGR